MLFRSNSLLCPPPRALRRWRRSAICAVSQIGRPETRLMMPEKRKSQRRRRPALAVGVSARKTGSQASTRRRRQRKQRSPETLSESFLFLESVRRPVARVAGGGLFLVLVCWRGRRSQKKRPRAHNGAARQPWWVFVCRISPHASVNSLHGSAWPTRSAKRKPSGLVRLCRFSKSKA